MWQHEMWGPSGMWMFPLLILAILILLLVRGFGGQFFGRPSPTNDQPNARQILDRRYANGEISREEYRRMRTDLG
jgi:putative membrane protein